MGANPAPLSRVTISAAALIAQTDIFYILFTYSVKLGRWTESRALRHTLPFLAHAEGEVQKALDCRGKRFASPRKHCHLPGHRRLPYGHEHEPEPFCQRSGHRRAHHVARLHLNH